jgi:hypothetical protein
MLKDYSKDISMIKKLLSEIYEKVERIDTVEKNVNAMFDNIEEIRRKIGLEGKGIRRRAKRHQSDIRNIVLFCLNADPEVDAEYIFRDIVDSLAENDGIESPYSYDEYIGVFKNEEKQKIWDKWESKIKPEWIKIIEDERSILKRWSLSQNDHPPENSTT